MRLPSTMCLVLVGAFVAGCAHSPMFPSPVDVRSAPDSKAVIWFVRPDGGHRAWSGIQMVAIADQDGHFVGTLLTGERFAVLVPPGKHTYFAFRASGSKTALFHQDAGPPEALIIEGAAGQVYVVEVEMVEDQGFATFAPASPRCGRDHEYVDRLLAITKPYGVNLQLASKFDRDHGSEYWWDHGWRRAAEAISGWGAPAIEEHTMHASDGFSF